MTLNMTETSSLGTGNTPGTGTPGQKFRTALLQEKPLQIVGTINAYSALLAKKAGFKAIYLSGAGVANASFGLPDLGLTTLAEVANEARRITSRVDLPLLVDGDTGWGTRLNIQRAIKTFIEVGAAGVHFEDQAWPKRCGHHADKKLVSKTEMADRIQTAVFTRDNKTADNSQACNFHIENTCSDPHFVIIARTDAIAVEGLYKAIERAIAYQAAGADIIFAEAVTDLKHYQQFVQALKIPVLANITEFGVTPIYSLEDLKSVKIACVLYPLSAFRAMSKAAENVYQTIRTTGSQQSLLSQMQSREDLYEILNYAAYQKEIERDKYE